MEKGGSLSRAYKAMNWMLDEYRSASVINLSFRYRGTVNAKKRMEFESIVQRAKMQNAIVVAAIGNTSSRSAFPASAQNVLAAGALDANETICPNSGQFPDLVAPAVEIFSCVHAASDEAVFGVLVNNARYFYLSWLRSPHRRPAARPPAAWWASRSRPARAVCRQAGADSEPRSCRDVSYVTRICSMTVASRGAYMTSVPSAS